MADCLIVTPSRSKCALFRPLFPHIFVVVGVVVGKCRGSTYGSATLTVGLSLLPVSLIRILHLNHYLCDCLQASTS